MHHDFDYCPDRRCTESDKWNHFDDDVLPMWVADMDFPSPPAVIQALQERAAHGVFGYPCYNNSLRQAVVDWVAESYHWEIEPDQLVFLPGVVAGFNLAAHLFSDLAAGLPGTLVVQPPVYPPMLKVHEDTGLGRADALLQPAADGTYQLSWESLESALAPPARMFLLCNPHNPTGRVFQRQELERIAEVCLSRGVPICSDEIHADLVYPGNEHLPIASLHPDIAQNSITLIAPSKTFNIAGLQFSAAIVPNPELRRRYQQSGRGLLHSVNLMGITAAEAAYRYGRPWLQDLLLYLEDNRDFLLQFVTGHLPGVRMAAPQATYLAWLDCRSLNLPE
jgi:cysteine-S-conjugate beta-lyase